MPRPTGPRVTKATGRMAANMKALIEHMRAGPVTAADVTDVLGYTFSGARKYLFKLRDASVVRVTKGCNIKHTPAFYSLINDEGAIESYLSALLDKQPSVEHIQRQDARNGYLRDVEGSLPGSHIYTSRDDTLYSTKKIDNTPVEVKRDPLDVALFGPARAAVGGA